MKPLQHLLVPLLLTSTATHAALYSSGTLDTIVPDGNPNGISSTIDVSGFGAGYDIADVNIFINVSGGFNGDLYAYLSFGDGSVVLLNRIGKTESDPFGSDTAGFDSNFRFDDAGLPDIHSASAGSGPITGVYQADRRTTNPQLVLDTDARGAELALFNGSSPNGGWTLFLADMAGGGGSSSSMLESWGVEFTVVPEPTTWALGIFGVLLAGVAVCRRLRTRPCGDTGVCRVEKNP